MIQDIVAPEGSVNIPAFKIISCSKINNPLVFDEVVGAEMLAHLKTILLADQVWNMAKDFLKKEDISLLIKFFQIIAHEKRHATLGNTVEVNPSVVRFGPDPSAANRARYMIHEILVKRKKSL